MASHRKNTSNDFGMYHLECFTVVGLTSPLNLDYSASLRESFACTARNIPRGEIKVVRS